MYLKLPSSLSQYSCCLISWTSCGQDKLVDHNLLFECVVIHFNSNKFVEIINPVWIYNFFRQKVYIRDKYLGFYFSCSSSIQKLPKIEALDQLDSLCVKICVNKNLSIQIEIKNSVTFRIWFLKTVPEIKQPFWRLK